MKVLLIKDVAKLGKQGDIVEVKDGYGQNFLIAKGFAKLATNEVVNKFNALQKKKEQLEALELAQAKQIEEALSKIELKIEKKVGANNHLFGSLTKEDVSLALSSLHRISLDKKLFLIPQIKSLGSYEGRVNLGHGIHAKLNLLVVAKQ